MKTHKILANLLLLSAFAISLSPAAIARPQNDLIVQSNLSNGTQSITPKQIEEIRQKYADQFVSPSEYTTEEQIEASARKPKDYYIGTMKNKRTCTIIARDLNEYYGDTFPGDKFYCNGRALMYHDA
jgi:hypothetical protein